MARRLSWAEANDALRQQLRPLVSSPDLRPADAYRLTRTMRREAFASGQLILPAGAMADCLGLVVEGEVAVHTRSRVGPKPKALLGPGQAFGQGMLLDGRPCEAAFRSQTRCEIWFVHRSDLGTLLRTRSTAHGPVPRKRPDPRGLPVRRPWVRRSVALVVLCIASVLAASSSEGRQAVSVAPMGLGEWCSQRGYASCAEQAWELSATLAPDDANALIALGSLYAEQGDLSSARRTFEAAGALEPDSAEVWNNLGYLYAQEGNHDRATDAYRRASDLEPGVAETEYNLGLSLQALGQHEEAAARFESALALGAPPARTMSSVAIARLDGGQLELARAAARDALDLDGEHAPAYAVLGAAELAAGLPEGALPYLQQSITLDPDSAPPRAYRGLAYLQLGQTDEAKAEFLWALAAADDQAARTQIRQYVDRLAEGAGQASSP